MRSAAKKTKTSKNKQDFHVHASPFQECYVNFLMQSRNTMVAQRDRSKLREAFMSLNGLLPRHLRYTSYNQKRILVLAKYYITSLTDQIVGEHTSMIYRVRKDRSNKASPKVQEKGKFYDMKLTKLAIGEQEITLQDLSIQANKSWNTSKTILIKKRSAEEKKVKKGKSIGNLTDLEKARALRNEYERVNRVQVNILLNEQLMS